MVQLWLVSKRLAWASIFLAATSAQCGRKDTPATEQLGQAAPTASLPTALPLAATAADLFASATQVAQFDPAQPTAETTAERLAIEQIGEVGVYSPQAEARLAAALRHPDQDVRGHACWGLGRLAPHSHAQIASLVAALGDSVWSVQHNAGWALVRFGKQAMPALDRALRDGPEAVRIRAALAMLEITPESSAQCEAVLLAADVTASAQQGSAVLLGLGKLQQPSAAAIDRLRAAAVGETVEAALTAIGALGPKAVAATPAVVDALRSNSKTIRQLAAATAGNLGAVSEALVEALIGAASDKDEHVASEAIGALSRLDALDALARLATHGADASRALAVSATGVAPLWSQKRLAILVAASADPAWQVRLSAVAAFQGRQEATSAAAKALLKRALADANDAVRDQAAAVLAAPRPLPAPVQKSDSSKGSP